MSAIDIRMMMNSVSQEKAELEALKARLLPKTVTKKTALKRDSAGMEGTKYKNQHEQIKDCFANLSAKVLQEKDTTLSALDAKINNMNLNLENLQIQLNAALAAERLEAAQKAAKAREAAERAEKEREKNGR